jgi:hypothetical protein
MYEYDDFYNEPSELEMQVEEFKSSLMASIKDEYKAEMARLRKENAELKPIKDRMQEIELERNREKNDLEQSKLNAFREAKKMRLTELLKDYKAVIYTVDSNRIYEPKCDLCDDNRQVEYKTPLGRTAKEDCSCKTYTTKHEIREVDASYIEHYSSEYGIKVGYYDEQREERVMSYHMYKDGTAYAAVTPWTYFKDKEEIQKYCDWLTAKEGEGR